MPQAPKVTGLTFYTANPDGPGFLVWALIGGTWQRYHHEDSEVEAGRMARKIGRRLADCAKRRKEEASG